MDDADKANRHVEILHTASLQQSLKPTVEGVATGACWFCGDDVEPGRRWCNAQCRDDWEMENE